jgi:hypothetical protein
MTEKEAVYEMILRRPLAEVTGRCALYEYTALQAPRFALVHAADTIVALMDELHTWLQPEIEDTLTYDETFWQKADASILAIADDELRAFVQYALHMPIVPIYAYEASLYLEGLLETLPGYRFVMGWEARAPRQDQAYGIVEQLT